MTDTNRRKRPGMLWTGAALIALAVIIGLVMIGVAFRAEPQTGTLTSVTIAQGRHGWRWVGTVALADGRTGTVRRDRLATQPTIYEGQTCTVYTLMGEMALTPFEFELNVRILPVGIVLLLAGAVTIGNARKPKKPVNEARPHPSNRHKLVRRRSHAVPFPL